MNHYPSTEKIDGTITFLIRDKVPPTRQQAVPVIPCRSSERRLRTALSATSPVQLQICGDVTDAAKLAEAKHCFTVTPGIRIAMRNTATIARQCRYTVGNAEKINGDDMTTLRQADESERRRCFDSAPRMLRYAMLESVFP